MEQYMHGEWEWSNTGQFKHARIVHNGIAHSSTKSSYAATTTITTIHPKVSTPPW
jgi:hypothetical protein